ncbi:MAG TPA: T9SS type A sorting domain-containing protein [bacterium]|nr:T9SS type A sorting domain-containing protein [bacterium]
MNRISICTVFLTGLLMVHNADTFYSGAFGAEPSVYAAEGIDKWSLWSNGVSLRGANIFQRRVYPELDGTVYLGDGPTGPPYTPSDLHRLAEWGANAVNISHPGLFTETPPYWPDPEIEAGLDSLVAWAGHAGLYVIISFRTGPGRSEFTFFWPTADPDYLNDRVWGDEDAQDGWVEMWKYTAGKYASNPSVVAYNLMVGPNSNEVGSDALNGRLDMWDPAAFYAEHRGTLYDWNRLGARLVDAIRSVDTETPIIMESMGYGSVKWLMWLDVPADSRVVAGVHQYDPYAYAYQGPSDSLCYPGFLDTNGNGELEYFNRAWIVDFLAPLDTLARRGTPVAVTEVGIARWASGGADCLRDQFERFELIGADHFMWIWESTWEPAVAKGDNFNFRLGPDPENRIEVSSSPMIEVIQSSWSCNALFNTGVDETAQKTPLTFLTAANYPNPFNSMTDIVCTLASEAFVTVTVYNLLGQAVTSWTPGWKKGGSHQWHWDAGVRASGLYFYRIEARTSDGAMHQAVGKMVYQR